VILRCRSGTADSIVSWVEAQGSYRSCTFTQRKCLIKLSERVFVCVVCGWQKKMRSVWAFCIVFGFTVRPPPLDLSTISECPFHVPLTRTMTEPRWDLLNTELWQTLIYRSKGPRTLCVILFSISVCVLNVKQRYWVCLPHVTWSLFPASAQAFSHLHVCDTLMFM